MSMIPDEDLKSQGYEKRDTYMVKSEANKAKAKLEASGYTAIIDQTATGFWNLWSKRPIVNQISSNIRDISV